MIRPNRKGLAALAAVAVLAAVLPVSAAQTAAAETAAADGGATAVRYTFEGTTEAERLAGWKVVEGSFGRLITDRALNYNAPKDPFRKEGTWFMSTLDTAQNTASDGFKGVVVSPPFTAPSGSVTALVGGGSGSATYLALCTYDAARADGCGAEIAVARGANSEVAQLRTLPIGDRAGTQMVLKLVDNSTGSWGHITVDDIRIGFLPAPVPLTAERTSDGDVQLSWKAVAADGLTGYVVERSTKQKTGYAEVTTTTETSFADTTTDAGAGYFYRVSSVGADGARSIAANVYARPYANLTARGETVTYSGDKLKAIKFPVGPIGDAGIIHDGAGERRTWWIFGNKGRGGWHTTATDWSTGVVPNSFFGISAKTEGEAAVVRALQTKAVGSFEPMDALTFQGEYPLADYAFQEDALPVEVSERVFNPSLPGNLKDSGIPTAIYEFTVTNTSDAPVSVDLLATQQNAVGFDGYSTIGGADKRNNAGYGGNANTIVRSDGATSLRMANGAAPGTMTLTALGSDVAATASWANLDGLRNALASGSIDGPATAAGDVTAKTTVDGALSVPLALAPGESAVVPIVLSWHFPDVPTFHGSTGQQYENWWSDATAVDAYVRDNLERLTGSTQEYHDALYDSNLPQYLLDRVTSSQSVLHSPAVYWDENGFFGGREGYGCCTGMPTHVWQYAQGHAALHPDLGAKWTEQWLGNMKANGEIPQRFRDTGYNGDYGAIDGQLGVILSAYRAHLQSPDGQWATAHWGQIEKALEFVVTSYDSNLDGVMTGTGNTTLDGGQSNDGSWIGSMYLASLRGTAELARAVGDNAAADRYSAIAKAGSAAQNDRYWNGEYFNERVLPGVTGYGNGVEIDMLLGQWWSTQLGLGDLYDSDRLDAAAHSLFQYNYRDHNLGQTEYDAYSVTNRSRNYVLDTDGGLMMITWPKEDAPNPRVLYDDEYMSGFEYSAAALMLQRGDLEEGLRVVKAISDRYDGTLRTEGIDFSPCSVFGDGTGNPFGDDECGSWYSRTLASWSLLTGLQGLTIDNPAHRATFAPVWQPEEHRSFFTSAEGFGVVAQEVGDGKQTVTFDQRSGSLTLGEFRLRSRIGAPGALTVTVGGETISGATVVADGEDLTVKLPATTTIEAGTSLVIVLDERVAEPELTVSADVEVRMLGGRGYLSVRVKNDNDVPVDLTITTPYGVREFADVAPGASAYRQFTTRLESVPAGEVQLRLTGEIEGRPVVATKTVPYAGT